MLELDHLAVSGTTLEAAVAHVEDSLGVALAPGGRHDLMGTHNRLLSLGHGLYLEAIAIDPHAPAPDRPRWFDLDRLDGPARLNNWITRTDDLARTLTAAPEGIGVPIAFTRGDFAWVMAVPEDGRLPFGGAAPAVIAWDCAIHPADRLPDAGCRLSALEVGHPDAAALTASFPALTALATVSFVTAPTKHLRAEIVTPSRTASA